MHAKDQRQEGVSSTGVARFAGEKMNKEIAATGTAYRSNAAQASIGRQLQVMYDEIVCQPLPPEVVTLMKKLEHE